MQGRRGLVALAGNVQDGVHTTTTTHVGNDVLCRKYVWRTYCLVQGQTLLTDNRAKLLRYVDVCMHARHSQVIVLWIGSCRYGVGNQTTLHFTKRLKNRSRNI